MLQFSKVRERGVHGVAASRQDVGSGVHGVGLGRADHPVLQDAFVGHVGILGTERIRFLSVAYRGVWGNIQRGADFRSRFAARKDRLLGKSYRLSALKRLSSDPESDASARLAKQ